MRRQTSWFVFPLLIFWLALGIKTRVFHMIGKCFLMEFHLRYLLTSFNDNIFNLYICQRTLPLWHLKWAEFCQIYLFLGLSGGGHTSSDVFPIILKWQQMQEFTFTIGKERFLQLDCLGFFFFFPRGRAQQQWFLVIPLCRAPLLASPSRKLRLREIKGLSQGHPAEMCRSQGT